MAELPSRRQFLITVGSVAAVTLAACKSGAGGGGAPSAAAFTCTDVSSLGGADIQARNALGYEDRTADPAKACTTCLQWIAAPAPTSLRRVQDHEGPHPSERHLQGLGGQARVVPSYPAPAHSGRSRPASSDRIPACFSSVPRHRGHQS